MTLGRLHDLVPQEGRQLKEHQGIAPLFAHVEGECFVHPLVHLRSLGKRHDGGDVGIGLIANLGMDDVQLAGVLVEALQVEGVSGLLAGPGLHHRPQRGLIVEAPGELTGDANGARIFLVDLRATQFPGEAQLVALLLLALELNRLGAQVDQAVKPSETYAFFGEFVFGLGFGLCANGTPR